MQLCLDESESMIQDVFVWDDRLLLMTTYVHAENEVEFTSPANDDCPKESSPADSITII